MYSGGSKLKLKCLHGFFIFEDLKIGELSDYMALTGFNIVKKNDYYTFDQIKDAPDYSIIGSPLLGTVAKKTFEGYPWDVFEKNGIVYNFSTGLVQPILTVVSKTTINVGNGYFVASGLILPGAITSTGQRVKSYSAFYTRDRQSWLYSEVDYV